MRFKKGPRWPSALLGQSVMALASTFLLLFLALNLPSPASGIVYMASMWGALPLLGAISAYLATRKGLTGYVAWAVPAICQTALHWGFLGYPPESPGMPLLNAALCLFFAAAGDVVNQRKAAKKR